MPILIGMLDNKIKSNCSNINNSEKKYNSFIRYKKFDDRVYAYEITPYKDPMTGKFKQKTKYLGKINDETKEIKKKHELPKPPKSIVNFGDAYLFNYLVEELNLKNILLKCFPEELTNLILTLSGYRLLNGGAVSHLESYIETSDIQSYYPVSFSLSSQNISRYLEQLGADDLEAIHHFFMHWSLNNSLEDGENILFDLTSFSSNAKLIELLELGYSRDDSSLPQVNLGLLVNRKLNIPLYYKLYPGSIKDVSTIVNLVAELKILGLNNITIIMDRGFFSKTNIYELIENDYSFVIPLPLTSKELYLNIINKNRDIISDVDNLSRLNGKQFYSRQGYLKFSSYTEEKNNIRKHKKSKLIDKIESVKFKFELIDESGSLIQEESDYLLYYYLYLDNERFNDEKRIFNNSLLEAYEKLEKYLSKHPDLININTNSNTNTNTNINTNTNTNNNTNNIKETLYDITGNMKQYFSFEINENNQLRITKNKEAIENTINLMGKMILISRNKLNPKELLINYKERDKIEKMFDSMKNELSGLPVRAHKTNTLKGYFFIHFISLIIQYHLIKKIKKTDIDSKYSTSEIFFELQKLKKIIWFGKQSIINELSKTQKMLLKLLKINVPMLIGN